MTINRFKGIVLKLGNQMFVRHFLWLNYPNDTKIMGIKFKTSGLTDRLNNELNELGFRFDEKDGIWKIERSKEHDAKP